MGLTLSRGVSALAIAFALVASLAIDGWGVGLLGTAVALTAIALFAQIHSTATWPRACSLDVTVGAFSVWIVASVVVRDLPWAASYYLLAFLLVPLGYAVARVDAECVWRFVRPLVVALAASMAAVSLALALAGEPVTVQFASRNNQSGLLNIGLFLALASAPLEPRRHAFARYLALVVIAAGVVATLGRGATLALCAAVVATFIVGPRGARLRLVRAYAAIAGGFVAGLLATNLGFVERVASIGAQSTARWNIWASALPLVTEKPVIGHGLGMTEFVWAPIRMEAGPDGSLGRFLHNDYLQFGIEVGLVSVVLLAAVFIAALHVATRVADTDLRATAALGAIVTLAVHCLVDYHLQLPVFSLVFGLTLGALAALDGRAVVRDGRALRWGSGIVAGILVLNAGILVAYDRAMPGADTNLGRIAGGVPARFLHFDPTPGDQEAARLIERLRTAHRLQPDADEPLVALGAILRMGGDRIESERVLLRAIELNPYAYHAHYQLSLLEFAAGDSTAALAHLEIATDLRPRFLPAHELIFELHLSEGREDAAYAQARIAMLHMRDFDPRQLPFLESVRRLASARYDVALMEIIDARRTRRSN